LNQRTRISVMSSSSLVVDTTTPKNNFTNTLLAIPKRNKSKFAKQKKNNISNFEDAASNATQERIEDAQANTLKV
jgi:hypothetical protein